jgi:nickel-dependent lactate racemase
MSASLIARDGIPLGEADVAGLLAGALGDLGRRVLLVIPDLTRSAPVPLLFRLLWEQLAPRLDAFDILVALGTHQPLSEERFLKRVGVDAQSWSQRYATKSRWFNHAWDDDASLRYVGELDADTVERLSEGRMRETIRVRVNRLLFDYDHVLVLGPVFPHEVAGFSGGNKYFFPGVAGPELLNMFHWLGALVTNAGIIGHIDTPVRAVLDAAAALLRFERTFIHMVVSGNELKGLFVGRETAVWRAAAELSSQLNVRWMPRAFDLVVAEAPARYDDLWTAAKAVYKSEPVVADGGEVIVYAPHIREVSVTHGPLIEAVGYHVRDYFTHQAERFKNVPGSIKAHSTHVRGAGTYHNGVETARMQVTLATGISREVCERIHLGYRDPGSIRLEDFSDREAEGVLLIRNAGEVLYRLA